jgi:hypothetical protein
MPRQASIILHMGGRQDAIMTWPLFLLPQEAIVIL